MSLTQKVSIQVILYYTISLVMILRYTNHYLSLGFPNSESTKHYQDNPIEYKFNNNGFRTPDDFNSEDEGQYIFGL